MAQWLSHRGGVAGIQRSNTPELKTSVPGQGFSLRPVEPHGCYLRPAQSLQVDIRDLTGCDNPAMGLAVVNDKLVNKSRMQM